MFKLGDVVIHKQARKDRKFIINRINYNNLTCELLEKHELTDEISILNGVRLDLLILFKSFKQSNLPNWF